MPFPMHTVELVDGSSPTAFQSKLIVGELNAVANLAGGSAGVAVTTAVAFAPGALPASYAVHVTPSQACFISVTTKTNTGFNVVLTPTTGSVTLAAGTFDVVVVG
jgi:cytoskeletal protein RodZ